MNSLSVCECNFLDRCRIEDSGTEEVMEEGAMFLDIMFGSFAD